jgi:hypothetical protein
LIIFDLLQEIQNPPERSNDKPACFDPAWKLVQDSGRSAASNTCSGPSTKSTDSTSEGEHAIGAATFDRALHLVYSSFSPVAGLLDRIREKLMAACVDA